LAADSALIGVELKPIVEKTTQQTPMQEMQIAEEIAKKEAEVTGKFPVVRVINNNFLYTYTLKDDNGPDLSDGSFVLNTLTTNENVKQIIDKYDVSSNEYAENFNGITFRLSPGEYLIDIDADYYGDTELVLYIQGKEPYTLKQPIEDIIIKTDKIIVVALYGVMRNSNANHRLGRKTTASISIPSVAITPQQVNSCNAVSTVAPSYPTSTLTEKAQDPANDVVVTEPGNTEIIGYNDTGIHGVTLDDNQTQSTIIYDLQGRRIQNPTKGLYIVNGQKFVIK